ncbi:hypothetical protein ACIBEA_43460 [Streptomyces sp. NPDC051555]|uniref:hypothetical protein n=1 Tax=Streptomyces sp. NPDC051555 TaxID=3365657 RepID=UPI0037A4F2AE
MSYDLAVWEGIRPVDDGAATTTLDDLCRRYMRHLSDQKTPPSPLIRQYVEALLIRGPRCPRHLDRRSPPP